MASSSMALLAPALVGYGFVSASFTGGPHGKVAGLVASVAPAVALSVTLGPSSIVAAVICCLLACAAGELALRGRLTPGVACVAVALAALAQIGADSVVSAAQGTTIAASVDSLVSAYQDSLSETSVAAASLMQQVRAVMAIMWPTAYVLSTVAEYLFASVGVTLAVARIPEPSVRMPRHAEFDLPLWVVGVLVAGVAGLAFGLTASGPVAGVVLMVAANVVMALRVALAAQGLAVFAWLLGRHHLGPLACLVLGGAALYLEVQFFVMTLVGLVDVWANFRHLARGGRPGDKQIAGQD
ncbi:DUF2232 domain-containing protein [Olsenella profusa]|uniref:DUF2232 domain-containing protein n=1 Tax=Olsenella profusa TaxID=138595 RepID=A0ABS2F0G6_9ACTN|nr:DUF2232 domain-containing protein [Olsenella profusa]